MNINIEPLTRNFYQRETVLVAKELLGKYLERKAQEGYIVAKIVEVEAYKGSKDPASHAFRGLTERNRPMFEEAGCAYVYFIYGNHFCLNVTTEPKGVPGAVLIRAVEVVEGFEVARKNRHTESLVDISNGPGKLTEALNIGRTHNGLDLTQSNDLFICSPDVVESFEVIISNRVGIKVGREKLWRFYIKNNEYVSKP